MSEAPYFSSRRYGSGQPESGRFRTSTPHVGLSTPHVGLSTPHVEPTRYDATGVSITAIPDAEADDWFVEDGVAGDHDGERPESARRAWRSKPRQLPVPADRS